MDMEDEGGKYPMMYKRSRILCMKTLPILSA